MTTFPFEAPLPWLWSCHHCHSRYPLGVTRRCLHDGHYFCGGTTVSVLTGKLIKRHRACGSEFDYLGWEDVSFWQNEILESKLSIAERLERRHSCEHSCRYPSACHHSQDNILAKKSSRARMEDHVVPARPTSSETAIAETESLSCVDPNCLENKSSATAGNHTERTTVPALPNPKSAGTLLEKMIRNARRNEKDSQSDTTKEDVVKNALRPKRSAPPCPLSSSPTNTFRMKEPVGALASAKELGLVIPSLEISTDLPSFFSPDSSSSSSEETFSEADSSETQSDEEVEDMEKLSFEPDLSHHVQKTRRTNIPLPAQLKLEDISFVPDIDMTDSIPDSPQSPTSPSLPSMFTNHSLLTPKSPDSPTNPLFRINKMPTYDDENSTPRSLPLAGHSNRDWITRSSEIGVDDDLAGSSPPLPTLFSGTAGKSLGLGLDMPFKDDPGEMWDVPLPAVNHLREPVPEVSTRGVSI